MNGVISMKLGDLNYESFISTHAEFQIFNCICRSLTMVSVKVFSVDRCYKSNMNNLIEQRKVIKFSFKEGLLI